MDSLTQIILGAAVGEAVAGRKLGAKAAFWGAIGGTLPDLDVFLRFLYDPFDAALVHRGFSHSLLFALIAAPILGWALHRVTKQKYSFKMWTLLWFLSIVTHPLLDIFTNYGTQFLWPFSPRITFNTVFVIDPLYTVPFMVLLIGALFMKRDSKRRRIWNWTGIIYSSTYLLWGVIVKLCILSSAPSYFESADIHAKRVMVTPMPLTSFYWDMIAEDDSNYYVGYKSIFYDFNPAEIERIPKNHESLNKINWNHEDKRKEIEHITNGYYAVQQSNDNTIVFDLRFGTTSTLTNGKNKTPIMGYGIETNNNRVKSMFSYRTSAFKNINFSSYIHRIFSKK